MGKRVFLLLFLAVPAMASEWTFLGALSFTSPTVTTAYIPQASSMKNGFGGGATFAIGGFSALKAMRFETGLFLLNKKFTTVFNTVVSDLAISYFEIPLGFQFKIARWLHIGGGGYGAISLGKVATFAPSGPGSLQIDYDFSALNYSPLDAGLYANISFVLPVGPMASIVADFRSTWGLMNVDRNATNSLFLNNYHIFAGIRLGEGEQGQY